MLIEQAEESALRRVFGSLVHVASHHVDQALGEFTEVGERGY